MDGLILFPDIGPLLAKGRCVKENVTIRISRTARVRSRAVYVQNMFLDLAANVHIGYVFIPDEIEHTQHQKRKQYVVNTVMLWAIANEIEVKQYIWTS